MQSSNEFKLPPARSFIDQQLTAANVSNLGHPDAYMTYHMTSQDQKPEASQNLQKPQNDTPVAMPKLLSQAQIDQIVSELGNRGMLPTTSNECQQELQ